VLQGGMGMAAGANLGDEHGMFEPIHGSAPKYTGQDKANPMAMVLAVQEGLHWLAGRKADPKLEKAADAIERAVMNILERGHPLTYDLVEDPAKAARCSAVGTAIADEARKLAGAR
jgi:3-isopropylmalate dehydrogenase